MARKILLYFISLTILSTCFFNFAYAAENEIYSVSMQNNITNGYINASDIEMSVLIYQDSGESRTYDIIFEYQGLSRTEQLTAESGEQVSRVFSIEPKQGDCNIETTIRFGSDEIKHSSTGDFIFIRPYETQFMEEISKKGINGVEKSNLNYFNMMGLQSARMSYEWGWTETSPGVYNWPSLYNDIIDSGATPLFLACYGNSLYNGGQADKTGPTSKEEIDLFAKYVTSAAKEYPSIKYYEIWNEPNISFWLPEPNVYDYVNLLEVTSRELKEVDEDIIVIGAAIASSDYEYAADMFDLNAAASMDAFATHPYCYPANAEIYIADQMDEYERIVLEHGGWQIKVSTEFGWPTNSGYRGISDEEQAVELVKHFAIADYNEYEIDQIYRLDDLAINGSHDESYNEDNFGVVNYDKTLKPAVLAVKTMAEMTNGGIPFGVMDVPYGVSAYLYIKDKEVTAVIWKNERTNAQTPSELTFEGTVDVYDMNGNFISSGNTAPVTAQPVYVKGISPDTAARLMGYNLRTKFERKLSLMDGFTAIEGYDSMKSLLMSGADLLSFDAMPGEDEAAAKLDEYYETVFGGMIDLYTSGVFKGSDEQLASFLYVAYLGGMRMAALYMLAADTGLGGTEYTSALDDISDVQKVIEANGDGGVLPNSSRILRFAKEMSENLSLAVETEQENPMKDGMIKAWSRTISHLCTAAEAIAAVEDLTHDDILVQLSSSQLYFTQNEKSIADAALYNYKDEEITGVVRITDPQGNVVGESQTVTLAPKESMSVPVAVLYTEVYPGELSYLSFVSDSEVLKSVRIPAQVTSNPDISGSYETYVAEDFDPEAKEHKYRWMYSEDGENYYPMEYAVHQKYNVSTVDKDRYIACEVTPVYADGSEGEPRFTEFGIKTELTPVDVADLSAEDRWQTRLTPDEYKFKPEGTSREYVLLDVFSGETDSRYFVLSDFLTGNVPQHKTDPQNINPSDPDSVGYWLNTTYVQEGYSIGGASWPKLEEQIYNYIDKNHTWWVEAGIEGIEASDAAGYSYTAALGLLTESESIKYLGRYGWQVTTENGEWYNPWMIATGSALTNQYIQVTNFYRDSIETLAHSGVHTLNNVTPGTNYGETYPRPAFYLNDEFFKNVRLDLTSLGEEVKKIIRDNYAKEEMSVIYSAQELAQIGYSDAEPQIKRFDSAGGKTSAKLEIPDDAGSAAAAIYDSDGRCIGVKLIDNEDFYVEFDIEAYSMKLFCWEDINSMSPLYPAAEA